MYNSKDSANVVIGDASANNIFNNPLFDLTKEATIKNNTLAFLKGSSADTYAANATRCFNRSLYLWFHQIPLLEWRYYYGNTQDNIYNTS